MKALVARYRRSINPPYKPKDYLNLAITFSLLITVFLVLLVIPISQQQQTQSQAQITGPALSVSPAVAPKGTSVMVSWANLPPPSGGSYASYTIDLHKKGDTNSTFLYFTYLNCTFATRATDAQSSGQCNFPLSGSLESGLYELSLSAGPDFPSTPIISTSLTIEDSSPELPGYSMHVFSPNGGEQFLPGQSTTVRWQLNYWKQNVQPPLTTTIILQTAEGRERRGAVYPGTNTLILKVTTETLSNVESSQTVTFPSDTPQGCNYRLSVSVDKLFQLPEGGVTYPKDEPDGNFCIGETPPPATPTPTASPTPTAIPTPTLTPTPTTGIVTGAIFSSTGGTIAGAKIFLTVNGVKRNYTTDSQGSYLITNLPPGTYVVTYVASGYSQQKTDVTIKAGQTLVINVTLNKKR